MIAGVTPDRIQAAKCRKIHNRHFFDVEFTDQIKVMPLALDDRHIPLTGSRNFRDFGGYPTRCGRTVKRGVLFRSDGLWKLSDEDLVKLNGLVIRNICDLRRAREREMMPTRWHENAGVKNLHLPLIPDDGMTTLEKARFKSALDKDAQGARQVMVDLYRSMVEDARSLKNLRQIFQLIARKEELPVLIHCSGGKDRTGVSCALILSALGVDAADVMEDYMHSQTLYSERINIARAATQVFDHGNEEGWNMDAIRPVYNVDPSYLESALNHILDHYGQVENFVRQALEINDDEFDRIKANLIE